MEEPPLLQSTPAPPMLEKKRFHDLDALRASAMLLGIILHAILAFGQPGWPGYAPQNDTHWEVPRVVSNSAEAVGIEAPKKFSPYKLCFTAIHGFRMPLFFLVSGFFTAMLWRTRGTKELLKHRAKRILLPLAIFTPIAWITMLGGMGIGAVGAKVLFGDEGDSKGAAEKADNSITDAVIAGDLDAVKGHLNERADINQRNDKGETLLHIAAFFAHPEVMQFLLDKGVDPTIKSKKGETALNYVEGPWNKEIEGIYKFIGGLLRLELDLERIKKDRPKCAAILRRHESSGSRSPPPVEDTEPKGPLKNLVYRLYIDDYRRIPVFGTLKPDVENKSSAGLIDINLSGMSEGFAMVFEAELEIKEFGSYAFELGSDDGSKLFINGKELIDHDGLHAMTGKEGKVDLEPGLAKLRLEYFQGKGGKGLSLNVSGPGMDKVKLSRDARGFDGADWGEWDKGDFNQMVMKQLPEWLQWVLGIGMLAAMMPIFHHLWFLYYLVWMVLGFALVAWLAKKWNIKQWPVWIVASPLRWLWLVPITLVPQLLMGQSFGPDTAGGILPWPPVLLYYGIFFGVGALCYGHDAFEQKVGKFWPISFLLAIPVLTLGMCFMHSRNTGASLDFEINGAQIWSSHFWMSVCVVFYVWLMIFGCIGFFRTFFSGKGKVARYISDSSYWLYLAHLAPLMCLQMMFAKWEIPGFLKFVIYCVITTGVLLLMYEYLVRYTFIGTLLNGKRTREKSLA